MDREKIVAVQTACDEAAWLFAESGKEQGIVDVRYLPSRRHTSEQIFARLVRLWDAIDRPNARILLINQYHAEAAFRRTKNTAMQIRLTEK